MNVALEKMHRFSLSSSAVEALKWIALAAMLVDHVNAGFFDRGLTWAVPIGRLAMPIFALVIGYNLARPGCDQARLLRRLVLFGLLSWFPHGLLFGVGMLPLDVLFTFAAAMLVVQSMEERQWGRVVVLLLLATVVCDYSVVGVWLVIAAWSYFRDRTTAGLVNLSAALIGLCIVNGNAWALYGVLLFLFASVWTFQVPRIRWAFWIAYPAHLWLLALVKLAA